MGLAEILGAAVLVAGLAGYSWKMIEDSNDRNDKNVSTVYRRFDEFKEHLEKTHVRKEMCDILHIQVAKTLDEIKGDVKDILKEMRDAKSPG